MNYDWYGAQAVELMPLAAAISAVDKKKKRREIKTESEKIFSKVKGEEAALFHKILMEQHDQPSADLYRPYWMEKNPSAVPVTKNHNNFLLSFVPTLDATYINRLPQYSWGIQFDFTLATPYISRDDSNFYIIDNPVRKEKVFKTPMISPSSWKGNLRWVMRKVSRLEPTDDDDLAIVKLFGHERGQEADFKRGRLQFYPSFFFEIGMEVLNPHDRKTRAGTKPILIESIPADATGKFTLLYVPFDLMGKPKNLVRSEVANDLDLTTRSVREMMLTYGFSAKRTSGFGLAKDDFKSFLIEMSGVKPPIPATLSKQAKKVNREKMKKVDLADLAKAMRLADNSTSHKFDDTLLVRMNVLYSQLIRPAEGEVSHD